MTCIVALEQDGVVWMGGDSASSCETEVEVLSDPKVFLRDEFLMGYAGSFRVGQILQHSVVLPNNYSTDDMSFMCGAFVDVVKSFFDTKGVLTKDDDGEDSAGEFLVGYRGRIYKLQGGFAAFRLRCGYTSIGSGRDYAMGALYATQKTKNPQQRILAALKAATEFCPGVRPPFTILHT